MGDISNRNHSAYTQYGKRNKEDVYIKRKVSYDKDESVKRTTKRPQKQVNVDVEPIFHLRAPY